MEELVAAIFQGIIEFLPELTELGAFLVGQMWDGIVFVFQALLESEIWMWDFGSPSSRRKKQKNKDA